MIFYPHKKDGLFSIHSGEWDKVNNQWENVETAHTIIGETADIYITRFSDSSTPYWDEMGRYEASYCLPLGIHKSRLIRWKETQLSLF